MASLSANDRTLRAEIPKSSQQWDVNNRTHWALHHLNDHCYPSCHRRLLTLLREPQSSRFADAVIAIMLLAAEWHMEKYGDESVDAAGGDSSGEGNELMLLEIAQPRGVMRYCVELNVYLTTRPCASRIASCHRVDSLPSAPASTTLSHSAIALIFTLAVAWTTDTVTIHSLPFPSLCHPLYSQSSLSPSQRCAPHTTALALLFSSSVPLTCTVVVVVVVVAMGSALATSSSSSPFSSAMAFLV